jgi:hypothetical protein
MIFACWAPIQAAAADTLAPVISGIVVSGITTASVTITWTTNEPATRQVQYGLAAEYNQRTFEQANLLTTHSVTVTGLLAGRLYYYRVVSIDAAGNRGLSTGRTFTTASAVPGDTTPPTVAISAPSGTLRGNISVSATAADNVRVVGVLYLIDGIAYGTERTASPYSLVIDTRTLSNANHTIAARARDAAGNTRTSTSVSFTVDNVAPTISITSPLPYAWVSSNLTATATVTDQSVAGVQFTVDGSNVGSEDTVAPFSLNISTAAMAAGSHTLRGIARDRAGNITSSANVVFRVDRAAPTVSISAPAPGATVSGTVSATATVADAGSGIARVQFLIDGQQFGAPVTASPYRIQIQTTSMTNANHTISARVSDAAGNQTTSAAVTFRVANTSTPPTGQTISLTVHPYAGNGPADLVSNAIPFKPGALTNARNLRVLDGATEIRIATKVLAVWPFDNSIRTLLIQFAAPLAGASKTFSAQINTPRTTVDLTLTAVTWDLPQRIFTLAPAYLSDSLVFWEQKPLGQSGYPAWDAKQLSSYNAIATIGTAPCTDNDQYYDAISTTYQLYARTGSLQHLVNARRWALHHRRDQIYLTGPQVGHPRCAGSAVDNTRYTYPQGLISDYFMFGDEEAKRVSALVVDNFYMQHANIYYYLAPTARAWWTEREAAFALIGILAQYEATNNPIYLNKAKERVTSLHKMQVDNGRRAWVHNLYDHDPAEGCRVTDYGSSPWMSGMLLEAIITYHKLTGDPVARESILMALDDLKLRYLARGNYAGVSFVYLGCSQYSDGEPDLDNLISHAFGYAYRLTGLSDYRKVGTDIFNTAVTNAFSGSHKHYNQQFRSSGHFVAYITGGSTPIPTPDTQAPSIPTGLAASAVSLSQINLTWRASVDNVSVTGYRIFRCQGSSCTPTVQVATTTGTSYQNTGLAASTTYRYAVAALDAAGNVSNATAPVAGTTQSSTTGTPMISSFAVTPLSIVSGQSATLSWSVTGATSISISPSIGVVSASGTRAVSRTSSTAYTVTAQNTAGAVNRSVTLTVTPGAPSGGVSPTGRTPRLLWTSERQGVWARMKADYNAAPDDPRTLGGKWYKLIKDNAECACRYSDNGVWGTLMFQMTGERKYADLAWAKINSTFIQQPIDGLNFSRENLVELVVFYDWLWPALSSTQRIVFFNKINALVVATGESQWGDIPVTYDSDAATGAYFGFALWYLETGSTSPLTPTGQINPIAVRLFTRPYTGGFNATGANFASLRNAVKHFFEKLALGGQWIESTDYNPGTTRIFLIGYEGVKTATGRDYFPEITAFIPQLAAGQIHLFAPDLNGILQWGDTEHPREFLPRLFDPVTTAGMVAGLAQRTTAGAYLQRLISDLATEYGPTNASPGPKSRDGYTAEPWGRFFYFYNPYAPQANWRALPRNAFAPGMGLMLHHDGWGPNDSFFSAEFPGANGVDHTPGYFGNFQLYRKGEWALTHPLGYGGAPVNGPDGTNTMIIGGLPAHLNYPQEFRNVVAREASDRYVYIAGTNGGQAAPSGAFVAPATYLHEWTRSILYLPSIDKRSDTIVVHDRTHAEDSRTLANFSGYDSGAQQAIRSAPARKQWVIHSPVRPTESTGILSWQTQGGQQVRVNTLLPLQRRQVVNNEAAIWGVYLDYEVHATERKWQARVMPTVDKDWDTFLNVVQVYDSGASMSNSLVRSPGGESEGVLVRRAGHPDALLMFNARPGARVPSANPYNPSVQTILKNAHFHTAGFTVGWTSSASTTEVYLPDLSPARKWRVKVDGQAETNLAVSSQGLGRLTVNGTGVHQIQVIASN